MSSPEVLGLPDGGPVFRYEGLEHPLPARVDYRAEGLFSVWLRGQAALAIEQQRKQMGPEWAARQEEGWRAGCAAGLYDFGSDACRYSILHSDAGAQHLAWLLLVQARQERQGPDVSRELVDRIWADREARERLRALLEQILDPLARGWLATSPPGQP